MEPVQTLESISTVLFGILYRMRYNRILIVIVCCESTQAILV